MTDTTHPNGTTTLTETVDAHLAGYGEPDRARRAELLGRAWNPQGRIVDPPMDAEGVAAIADLVDVVLTQFPEHRFERTTAVDEHHGHARYGWALLAPDGSPSVTGVDVAELDDDGRLLRVVGFFGDLPAR